MAKSLSTDTPEAIADARRAGLGDLIRGLRGGYAALAREIDAKGSASSIFVDLVNNRIPDWDIRGTTITTPEDVLAAMFPIRSPYFESLKVMVLDGNETVAHSQIIHVGALDASVADAKRIFSTLAALRESSGKAYQRIVLSHNHPSGDPAPSTADIRVQKRLNEIARAAGWEVVKRSDLPAIDKADRVATLAKHIRNGNPDAFHVIYLNTKLKLQAIERVDSADFRDTQKRAQKLLSGAARYGAYGIMVEIPNASAFDKWKRDELNEFCEKIDLRLLDIIALRQDGTAGVKSNKAGTLYAGGVNPEQDTPAMTESVKSGQTLFAGGSIPADDEARALALAGQEYENLSKADQELLDRVAEAQIQRVLDTWRGKPDFMLAPNGQPTKLNERQWAQVRTPLFKRWFGDWEGVENLKAIEALDPTVIENKIYTEKEAEAIYKSVKSVNLPNGKRGDIVNSVFGKLIRHKNGGDIIKIFPKLTELIEGSQFAYFENERNPDKHGNIVGFNNFVNKVKIGDDVFFVRFSFQHALKDKHELHNASLSEVEITKATAETLHSKIILHGDVSQTSGFVDKNLSQWMASVNPSSVSKIVDENGEPMVVWHNSPVAGISEFIPFIRDILNGQKTALFQVCNEICLSLRKK